MSLKRGLGANMEGLKCQTFNSLGNRKTKKASEWSNKIKAIFYEKSSDCRMGWCGGGLEARKSVAVLV